MTDFRPLSMTRATAVACAFALLSVAGAGLAAEPEHMDRPAPSREMRAKMASAHEQMAACLRSDRPIAACHEEMMKQHEMMGYGEHAGMGMGKGDCEHWPHHEHPMGGTPADKPADQPAQK
jgi:hypothetical protein